MADGALRATLDVDAVLSRPAPEYGAPAEEAEDFAVNEELNAGIGSMRSDLAATSGRY